MLRIPLASTVLILVCLGAAVFHLGDRAEACRGFKNDGKGSAVFRLDTLEHGAESRPLIHREVIWRPDSLGANPFGLIPTEWRARPQLLPGTWEVQTVFASDGRQR